MSADVDVLIIGAGAAGIGAARELAGSGLSTLMLEAAPRVGGRAWTEELAGMALDLGCGWLHSADRNPWTRIAEAAGFAIDRTAPAWDRQYRDLGFTTAERQAARAAFDAWTERLRRTPPASDRAADAIAPGCAWAGYLQALSGIINGDVLERISVADYLAYDGASTDHNWRVEAGYGALIAGSLPPSTDLRLATPVQALTLDGRAIGVITPKGMLHARGVIVTVSTAVLARGGLKLPACLDDWPHAASLLPLGHDEKLYLALSATAPFEGEAHLLSDPRDAGAIAYHVRPMDRPVIECYLGGEAAREMAASGPAAAFERAIDGLVRLLGSGIRRHLCPLAASRWTMTDRIGGAYSHALPGHAGARATLARTFDARLFFAGEATEREDFSTAHGAYASGRRAAGEALAALAR